MFSYEILEGPVTHWAEERTFEVFLNKKKRNEKKEEGREGNKLRKWEENERRERKNPVFLDIVEVAFHTWLF